MCRRNPSMRPNAGAPAVFWLMISVSLGHLVLSNILTMSHMLRQKRHIHSQWCMWMQKQTEVHPANMATSVQKDAQTEKKNVPNVPAAHAFRQRSKVFITIDVRIYNKKWWLNLLQSVLFKIELLSPSCCTLFSRTGKTMMINVVSTWIFWGEEREFLLKSFTHFAVIRNLHCGAMLKNNCIRIENWNGLAFFHACATVPLKMD